MIYSSNLESNPSEKLLKNARDVVGRPRKVIRGRKSRYLRSYETKTLGLKESRREREKPDKALLRMVDDTRARSWRRPGQCYRCHDSSFEDLSPPAIVILRVGLLI